MQLDNLISVNFGSRVVDHQSMYDVRVINYDYDELIRNQELIKGNNKRQTSTTT